jgi:hypothetical protein
VAAFPHSAAEGDLEGAVDQGQRALNGDRKSLPSLLMVTRDLTKVVGSIVASGEPRAPSRPVQVP